MAAPGGPQEEEQKGPAAGAPPRRLFQEEGGEGGGGLRFYVRPGAAKAELAPLIVREGGRLCRVQEPGAVLLAWPGEVPAGAPGGFVSTRYVTDCVARQQRLPLEHYRLEPGPRAAGKGASKGRVRFTAAEDQAMVLFVRSKRQGGQAAAATTTTGTALWKAMAQARVTPHPWQAMRDHYLKQLWHREDCYLPAESRQPGPAGLVAAASQSKEAMDQTHAAEGSKAQSIFQMANREFEDHEGDGENPGPAEDVPRKHTQLKISNEAAPPNPKVKVLEFVPAANFVVPQNQLPGKEQPSGPSAAEVAMAVEDMKHFMGKFKMDLATVTQAFLKNSGEVEAVGSCLWTGQRADGSPLWSRQDDVDLLKREGDFRSKLVAKYGAENVTRRVAFRES